MAHGVVCHFDLPHMAQKVADWTRREGRPRADEMAHGAVCRFELPHVAENNRRAPPNSHFVRKVKLRLAYRLAFVIKRPFESCLVDRLLENRFSKEVSWFPVLQNPNHGVLFKNPFLLSTRMVIPISTKSQSWGYCSQNPFHPQNFRNNHLYKIPIIGHCSNNPVHPLNPHHVQWFFLSALPCQNWPRWTL